MPNAFVFGPGAGPWHVIGSNCEMVADANFVNPSNPVVWLNIFIKNLRFLNSSSQISWDYAGLLSYLKLKQTIEIEI